MFIEDIKQHIAAVNRAQLTSCNASRHQQRLNQQYQSNTKLFVYGTLGPGQPNASLLTDMGGTWKEATVNGYLQKTDRARGYYYPLLQPHPDGPPVDGHVYISDALPANWSRLDRFEGPAYVRLLTLITYTAEGQMDIANIYADASYNYC